MIPPRNGRYAFTVTLEVVADNTDPCWIVNQLAVMFTHNQSPGEAFKLLAGNRPGINVVGFDAAHVEAR